MVTYSVAIATVNYFEKRRLIGTQLLPYLCIDINVIIFSHFGSNIRNYNNMCIFISRYANDIRSYINRSCFDWRFHWCYDNNSCCYFSNFDEVRTFNPGRCFSCKLNILTSSGELHFHSVGCLVDWDQLLEISCFLFY